MRRWRKWILILLFAASIPLAAYVLFNVVYNRTYLPHDLIPTAEHLMSEPEAKLTWVRIKPIAGSSLQSNDLVEVYLNFCNTLRQPGICDSPLILKSDSWSAFQPFIDYTGIFVNGHRFNGFIHRSMVGTGSYGTLILEFNPILQPGLHLFRIQIAETQDEQYNPDPDLSYEWAYRVE